MPLENRGKIWEFDDQCPVGALNILGVHNITIELKELTTVYAGASKCSEIFAGLYILYLCILYINLIFIFVHLYK